MFKILLKYFSKSSKNNTQKNPDHNIEMAFKLHGLVSAINNSSPEDKLKSLETLKQDGFINEAEFINAKNSLSTL